jgi:hypothetical protein
MQHRPQYTRKEHTLQYMYKLKLKFAIKENITEYVYEIAGSKCNSNL